MSFSSSGTYISTSVNGYSVTLPRQAIQPTEDQRVYWLSVLALVTEYITANPAP